MSDGEQDEELTMELPQIWQFVHPEYVRDDGSARGKGDREEESDEEDDEVIRKKKAPKLNRLLRFLNDIEEEEELEQTLQERDPVTQQTLLQWAARQQHFTLVEYLVKRAKRGAFGFPAESTEMAVYAKWEEMRPELPTAAELQAKQQERDKKRAERLAAKAKREKEAADGNDEEEEEEEENEEEEDEEKEPLPEELVYEALDEYHDEWGDRGVGIVKQIGELGVYLGARLRDGTKQGLGQALFPNGDAYTGEYEGNQRHGMGLYWWSAQGVMYVGRWHRGVRHGYGRIVYPDGSRYLGGWSRDKKHGNGHYVYADGSSYDGAWEYNKKQGYGVYRFTDGSSFHGSFVDNEFVSGEWRLASGTTRYVGNFSKDVPVGAGVFLHRLGPSPQSAFQQEGFYLNGNWYPGVLHGTTRVPPRLEVFAPNQEEPKRVPVTFAMECNGGTMVDLVKAVNFPPVQNWIKSLASVSENGKFGVVVVSIEICSVKYDPNDSNLVVEVRLRPVLHDAENKRLRLSTTGDETIILKQKTTRLILIVEQPGDTEMKRQPMVVLERSAQMPCAGPNHMQLRLPTVQVSDDGEIDGPFARAIQPTLRVSLNRETTTKQLLPAIHNNPMLGNAAEDVLMYVQVWHPDAYVKLSEKLQVASKVPPQKEEGQENKKQKGKEHHVEPVVEEVIADTEGCSYVAVPLTQVPCLSTEALTVIAATLVIQRREASELPLATAPKQRPPTPLPPAPEPRPELQPLYDARAALRRAEEAGSDEEEDDAGEAE